jgi:hypothetical protein
MLQGQARLYNHGCGAHDTLGFDTIYIWFKVGYYLPGPIESRVVKSRLYRIAW